MKLISSTYPISKTRIGFYYFPDTLHYRDVDAQTWLPELEQMGVGWLLLKTPVTRAIPESFITGLLQQGIQPLLHVDIALATPPQMEEITPLLQAYRRWGVSQIMFFDRPNARNAWSASTWSHTNLIEHFLDCYLPLAQAAANLDFTVTFPPLQPGGAYWDTTFLHVALESLTRRKQTKVLDHLALACYAWSNHHSLNWGSGGPHRWNTVRPYHTPDESQDHNGFRIYEWYQSIANTVLQKEVPIVLLQAATPADPFSGEAAPVDLEEVTAITHLLMDEPAADPLEPSTPLVPLQGSIQAAFFYQLCTQPGDATAAQAWFKPEAPHSPAVEILKSAYQTQRTIAQPAAAAGMHSSHPIQHYLLLPSYEWGVADWHLEMIRPLIQKYRPAIGFSLQEAALAREVTVIGSPSAFSEEVLDQLRLTGSLVRRMDSVGIEFASLPAER